MASQLYLPIGSPIVGKDGKVTDAMAGWMRAITQSVPASGAVSAVTATAPIVSSGGTTPNITHANSGVTAATYGDATHVPQIAVNLTGHITSATSIAISTGTVTTTGSPASGNLTKFSGATSITNGDLSGDVSTTSTLVTTIGTNKVTSTMLRQGVATSVIGRSANSTGNEADIQSTVENHVLVRRSSVLGFTLEQSIGYWSPLTDPSVPELVFDSFGDTISVWTAL